MRNRLTKDRIYCSYLNGFAQVRKAFFMWLNSSFKYFEEEIRRTLR